MGSLEASSRTEEGEAPPNPTTTPADAPNVPSWDSTVDGSVMDEDLEEETCGFCKFMKAGPCGTVFKV